MRPGDKVLTKSGKPAVITSLRHVIGEATIKFLDGQKCSIKTVHLRKNNPYAVAFWK